MWNTCILFVKYYAKIIKSYYDNLVSLGKFVAVAVGLHWH